MPRYTKPNACQIDTQAQPLLFLGQMYIVPGPEEDAESGQTMRGIVGGTKLFNRFTLQKVLGRGGMGVVWLAHDERLDRLIALKLVPESVSFDASAREDLKRETRKSLLLTHPNIVRIFDFIEEEHSAAISMEYVDGATLSSLRVKKPAKCFEVEEITPWVISLCDALTHAHDSAGLVHRDLKPANLMVNSRGDLKITDFGIACTMRDSMSYVSLPTSSGTLNYMSPQQLLGEDPSPADDIYAVGATLYEMLSSKPPFHAGDIASQVREVVPPTIAQRRAKFGISGSPIPKYWEETIARCLTKNPEHRPRTPADIAHRLRLGGPVRLSQPEPAPNIQLAKVLADLRDKLPAIDPRMAGFAGAILALIAAMIISFYHPKASAPHVVNAMDASSAPRPADAGSVRAPNTKSDTTYPRAIGYAMEKPEVAAVTAAIPKDLSETGTLRPITVAKEPASSSASSGTLQLTTTPPGARFAIYPGVVAGKSAPAGAPLRTGSAPDSIQDLPPGRYTLFFHNDGWTDDRVEISISAGESVPVDYTFPHGRATITSIPDRAEIFLGTRSLGYAPLDVDLPLGKQKLSARLSGFSERTKTITIENGEETNIEFQMRVRRSVKPTPTPTALDKIGQTFKNIFGHKQPPTREKR